MTGSKYTAKEFQNYIGQLTIPDVQQLVHVHQSTLQLLNPTPLKIEIIQDDGPSQNLVIFLPNCEQYEIIKKEFRIHNHSDEEISFKILNYQQGSLLVRFTPWSGKIVANSVSFSFFIYFFS